MVESSPSSMTASRGWRCEHESRHRSVSLVYTSTASQPFRESALEQLLTVCRRPQRWACHNRHAPSSRRALHPGAGGASGDRRGPRRTSSATTPDTTTCACSCRSRSPSAASRLDHGVPGVASRREAPRGVPGLVRRPGRRSDVDTLVRALTELTLWFRYARGGSVGHCRSCGESGAVRRSERLNDHQRARACARRGLSPARRSRGARR